MNESEFVETLKSLTDKDRPMKKAEACAYAQVSKTTLERWMNAGLKHFKSGPMFTKRWIHEFFEKAAIDKSQPKLRRVV